MHDMNLRAVILSGWRDRDGLWRSDITGTLHAWKGIWGWRRYVAGAWEDCCDEYGGRMFDLIAGSNGETFIRVGTVLP